MKEGFGEVGIPQLETKVSSPQRGSESVADSLETTTGGGVRLKHIEGFSNRLGQLGGGAYQVLDVTVVEVIRQFRLGVPGVPRPG